MAWEGFGDEAGSETCDLDPMSGAMTTEVGRPAGKLYVHCEVF